MFVIQKVATGEFVCQNGKLSKELGEALKFETDVKAAQYMTWNKFSNTEYLIVDKTSPTPTKEKPKVVDVRKTVTPKLSVGETVIPKKINEVTVHNEFENWLNSKKDLTNTDLIMMGLRLCEKMLQKNPSGKEIISKIQAALHKAANV